MNIYMWTEVKPRYRVTSKMFDRHTNLLKGDKKMSPSWIPTVTPRSTHPDVSYSCRSRCELSCAAHCSVWQSFDRTHADQLTPRAAGHETSVWIHTIRLNNPPHPLGPIHSTTTPRFKVLISDKLFFYVAFWIHSNDKNATKPCNVFCSLVNVGCFVLK